MCAAPALAAYERCIALPGTASSICVDDRADRTAGRCVHLPVQWHAAAHQFTGPALTGGHHIAEEEPDTLLSEALASFRE